MKRYALILGTFLCCTAAFTQTGTPMGWASFNGGTTGGKGGTVVTVENRSEFLQYVSSSEPYTLLIKDTIDLILYERIKVRGDKTIFGFTENAMLRYGGLEIVGNNVIIQNLIIGESYDGDWDGKTNSTDAITIYGENIWVDHCWLKTSADGLLDIRSGEGNVANYVTVSFVRFTDHNKVSLIGSSDSETQSRDKLKSTFHHCWFDGTQMKGVHQRMPRIRFGDIHMLNNYYEDVGASCIAARFESDVVVEGNYFRNCREPHFIADIGLGNKDPTLVSINNVYELSSGSKSTRGEAFIPANFYNYSLTKPIDVPALVMNEAGNFNRENNAPPVAVNDTIDYTQTSGGLNIFVTQNDIDEDSNDLRLANIVNAPNGNGFIKQNKIIYAPLPNSTGIDTIAYTVVDTEGGIDTGLVLIFFDGLTSIIENPNDLSFTFFPNPTKEQLTLSLNADQWTKAEVLIFNADGKLVPYTKERIQFKNQILTINTSNLAMGIYFLSVQMHNKVITKRFVKID